MYFTTYVALASACAHAAGAWSLPGLRLPWVHAHQGSQEVLSPPTEEAPVNRIAIVGAGAAGSAAAFWIGKARERYGLDVEVDIYDSNSYVGGRSTTVQPYDDETLAPIELGASIFVDANKNMWRATEEFGLEFNDLDDGDDTVGVWDGEKFLITTGGGSSWWDTLKVVWRYGIQAPRRTQALVDNMIKKFLTIYTPEFGSSPWHNLTELETRLEWTDALGMSTLDYFAAQQISKKWTVEMVEAGTRVNYGQNVDEIHALEGLVSLAAGSVTQVRGGNWQVFEQFVRRSNATVHLSTKVTSISQTSPSSFTLSGTFNGTLEWTRKYSQVLIAAPFHKSGVSLSLLPGVQNTLPIPIPEQPYVHLHVTLLSTSTPSARARYFKLPPTSKVPAMVLTSWEGARERNGTDAPEFNSLSYHGKITKRDGSPREGEEEWSVKIFSREVVEERWLRRVFGRVGWVVRKEWDAYPYLPPTTTFPPIKLTKGLYYVNAFEPFISTMETETIAARNVVELLMQEEYGASICKSESSPSSSEHEHEVKNKKAKGEKEKGEKEFVYGWDC